LGAFNDDDDRARRRRVHGLSLLRIANADFVFAYINEIDAFGTFAELGYAHARAKPIYICFGPNLTQRDDLWFIEAFAAEVFDGSPEKAFSKMLARARARWRGSPTPRR
jgi:nucleoside 2-deoxyribosyltransferase